MILSNLDQVPGTLWSLLLLAHFTGEKTVSERQSGGAQIQAKGSVVPEPVLLNFAASLCYTQMEERCCTARKCTGKGQEAPKDTLCSWKGCDQPSG